MGVVSRSAEWESEVVLVVVDGDHFLSSDLEKGVFSRCLLSWSSR